MNDDSRLTLRRARPEDARDLAELMNIAGEGIPAYLWSAMAGPGDDVMAFGAGRVARREGSFSYLHAHVADVSGELAGMLLGYPLPEDGEPPSLDELPEVVRPLVELETTVAGTWYINAVATTPAWRGRGIGSSLMGHAERMARESDLAALSLIVAEANEGAVRLYQRLGYVAVERRPVVAFPGCARGGNWLSMRKECAATPTFA